MIAYLKARLLERSTYAGISAVVAGAELVPEPYKYVVIALGVVAILVPNQAKPA